jgi:hypothetical protein
MEFSCVARDETPLPERQRRPLSGGSVVDFASDTEMTRENRIRIALMNGCVPRILARNVRCFRRSTDVTRRLRAKIFFGQRSYRDVVANARRNGRCLAQAVRDSNEVLMVPRSDIRKKNKSRDMSNDVALIAQPASLKTRSSAVAVANQFKAVV